MEESFFSSLQGWTRQSLGADFAGRYLGQLLAQVSRVDPKPFQAFFADVTGNSKFRRKSLRIDTEVGVRVGKRVRRADLVVSLDELPSLLVELKYRDILSSDTARGSSQLSDYLTLCKRFRNRPRFLLLHREAQDLEDLERIERARQFHAHHGALAPHLARSKHPASRMLLEYLREEGLVIEPVDTKQLYRFLHRFVLPWGGSGRINRTSEIDKGPMQFRRLLSNMRLMAADITPRLRAATRAPVERAATVDFSLINVFRTRPLAKSLQEARGKNVYVYADARTGGVVEVWAQNALVSSGEWLYVSYGFEFELSRAGKMSMDAYAYIETPETRKAAKSYWDDRFAYYGTVRRRWLNNWQKGDFEDSFLWLIRKASQSTMRSGVVTHKRSKAILKRLAAR